MRRGLVAVLALVALAAVPLAYALLPEQPVLTSARNERSPAAGLDSDGNDLFAYARSRLGRPNLYDALLRRTTSGGTTTVKLNTTGQGFGGGIDAPLVVYQQLVRGQSNIRLYNFVNGTRPATPAGVNTRRWEYHPTISGDWLLFGRDDNRTPTQRVMLHNSVTHQERTLERTTRATHALQADQVNGNWAVYTRCATVCNVIRYDIAARTRTTLAKPATSPPRHQYAASVTSDGTVYAGRSGRTCGSSVKIVRFGAADPATGTVVLALPRGRDFGFTHVRENADGTVDVFYERLNCRTNRFDLYKITDAP